MNAYPSPFLVECPKCKTNTIFSPVDTWRKCYTCGAVIELTREGYEELVEPYYKCTVTPATYAPSATEQERENNCDT